MNGAELARAVSEAGRSAGLAAVGFAPAAPMERARVAIEERRRTGMADTMWFTFGRPERSTDPSQALPDAATLVVAAYDYHRPEPADRPHAASVARYARVDHYDRLRDGLAAMALVLSEAGHRTRVLCDDNALVDREAAVTAGLGWYGKNANVLLPGVGSWFVLGSVLTDAVLPTADAEQPDGCGPCRRCLDGCPTGAIVEPGVVDARRCLAWLVQRDGVFPLEHRVALGDRIYGCDDCQEVCPPNIVRDRRSPGATADDGRHVDPVAMLEATDDELMERYGRWYVPRRDPAALRRNALVVLGNVGDGTAPATEAALARALCDDRPVVRAHAVWAAARLGRADLVGPEVRDDPDPLVRDEVEGAGLGG